ncbi:hypothetical protein EVAR_61855_1 [Eumeta japonica]|uniref:Uncharacterized protein n=1 Tax=Eumeta variegata TaxID=151549 RepID=A0A4C1ZAK9_EUMVA|nr:hypothetical protein EVAR_61855_1 [Eumeta japonica]
MGGSRVTNDDASNIELSKIGGYGGTRITQREQEMKGDQFAYGGRRKKELQKRKEVSKNVTDDLTDGYVRSIVQNRITVKVDNKNNLRLVSKTQILQYPRCGLVSHPIPLPNRSEVTNATKVTFPFRRLHVEPRAVKGASVTRPTGRPQHCVVNTIATAVETKAVCSSFNRFQRETEIQYNAQKSAAQNCRE